MMTVLLVVIFADFISLGIPDSLFGAAWPAIYSEFGLPVSAAGCVTALISCCTIVSSLMSSRVIRRFGTGMVTAASVCMTAVALLGFSFSNGLFWFCLMAVPLGLGAGSVDTALNNYVALHYKAVHMNLLHCFYGIGVSLSPGLMSAALSGAGGWRAGYRTVACIQGAIAVIALASLPLWKKAAFGDNGREEEPTAGLTLGEQMRMAKLRAVWLMFFGSCALEYTAGIWGSTFLVNCRGMAVEAAAGCTTFYYVGMALGRFLSGVLSGKLHSRKLIGLGQAVTAAAILLLLLPLPKAFAVIGLFGVGLGNGPVFPNLIHLTPENFGRKLSGAVMGSQMASSYIGVTLMPPLFGLLANRIGVGLFPAWLLAMFLLMLLGTGLVARCREREAVVE